MGINYFLMICKETMSGISIGKYEVTKLKNREKVIMQELKNCLDTSPMSQGDVSNIFDFKTIKLRQELKLLRTRLKIMENYDDDIA